MKIANPFVKFARFVRWYNFISNLSPDSAIGAEVKVKMKCAVLGHKWVTNSKGDTVTTKVIPERAYCKFCGERYIREYKSNSKTNQK